MTPCPCHSQKPYDACCGRFIGGHALPSTPLELMRSRYTAFTQANMDYVQETQCGPAAEYFDRKMAKSWAEQSIWLGLDIISAPSIGPFDMIGYVTFRAHYSFEGKTQQLNEKSRFEKIDDRWFYVGGKI